MTNEQAAKCIEFKYFEVDLSFKRVYGDINELEFNAYEEKSRTSKLTILIVQFDLLIILN
jgi:hypothetical protein